jgi:GTP-binding protein
MKVEPLNEYRISTAEFVAGAIDVKGLPLPILPEIAFAGRSNAGKSSVMNTLVQRKSLVRTSSTPGCTRQLNVFEISLKNGPTLGLVDLPGYGYARLSKSEKSTWGRMIETYITARATLRAVVLIVDVRRGIEEDDRGLLDFVATSREAGVPPLSTFVVATKLDKLPMNQHKTRLAQLKKESGIASIGFSAVTGEGRDELWKRLLFATAPVERTDSAQAHANGPS